MPSSFSKPTIADVAEAAGVSTTTVARVLHDRPDVKESTRQHVWLVIDQLGYRGARTRRHEASESIRYVTVIAHAVDNEYIGTVMRGILDQLELDSYELVLHLTQADLTREIDYVRVAQRTGSDGLLVVTPRIRGRDLSDLAGGDVPYAFIDYYPDSPAVPCVRATNWQGAREATNYLISLGHRRIGFVAGRRGDQITEAREHGYRSALADVKEPFRPELIRDGDYGLASGYRAAAELLALDPRPTAILASSDMMAMGVIQAAHANGLRVPEDLSVVGFDDLPLAESLYPPLTTVRQPLYEMGRMATQMVTTLSNGKELVSRQIELPTQLIVRGSCCGLDLG